MTEERIQEWDVFLNQVRDGTVFYDVHPSRTLAGIIPNRITKEELKELLSAAKGADGTA